jgi:alkylhydroperoxidase family enzyme
MDVAHEAAVIETLAGHPAVYDWYHHSFYDELFFNARGNMTLPPELKELIKFKLSMSNGCFVCNSFNVGHVLDAGYSQAQVDAILAPTPEVFSEAELAVIELADQISLPNTQGELTPDLYERLQRHFTDAQVIEMGAIAAILTGWAKFLFVFDLVTREANCPVRPPATA